MPSYNTLVVLAGAGLLGASSGLAGTFAVLRGRSLTGDALAHAALPGLCLAFLVVGHKSLPAMLAGALVSGIIGVALISFLTRATRIKEDAAIGIVLSVFFGAGVALSGWIQRQVTDGSKAGLDSYIFGKTAGMIAQDVYLTAGCALTGVVLIAILFKEFQLVAFDMGFARSQGWPAWWLDLALMALIAVNVVIGLPAVGVVLMAALLVLPAAAARFWTDRLGVMLAVASLFGLATGLIGVSVSATYSATPAGPIIVLTASTIFLGSLLAAPRRGAVARLLAHREFSHRLARRELLRVLFDLTEPGLPVKMAIPINEVAIRKSWTPSALRRLLRRAEGEGEVILCPDRCIKLTDVGFRRAVESARSHRLWKLFLLEHAELATSMADLAEPSVGELVGAEVANRLTRMLQESGRWPMHSDPVIAGGAV